MNLDDQGNEEDLGGDRGGEVYGKNIFYILCKIFLKINFKNIIYRAYNFLNQIGLVIKKITCWKLDK